MVRSRNSCDAGDGWWWVHLTNFGWQGVALGPRIRLERIGGSYLAPASQRSDPAARASGPERPGSATKR